MVSCLHSWQLFIFIHFAHRFLWRRSRVVALRSVAHPLSHQLIWRIRNESNWSVRDSETALLPPSAGEENWSALLDLRRRSNTWRMTTVNWLLWLSSCANRFAVSRSKWWSMSTVAVRLDWATSSNFLLFFNVTWTFPCVSVDKVGKFQYANLLNSQGYSIYRLFA